MDFWAPCWTFDWNVDNSLIKYNRETRTGGNCYVCTMLRWLTASLLYLRISVISRRDVITRNIHVVCKKKKKKSFLRRKCVKMYKANIFHDRVSRCKRFRYFSKEISNTYIAHVPGYPLTTLHTHTYSYIYINIYTLGIYIYIRVRCVLFISKRMFSHKSVYRR